MLKNSIWLSSSLFCSQSSWTDVLKKGIKPFLIEIIEEKLCKSFNIEFNYLCGENIRLSLLTDDSPETVAKKTDDYFKDFFSVSQLHYRDVKLPVNGIFLPFPPNTIQYGLYQTESSDKAKHELNEEFSLLLLNVLADDVVDEESILTFAFYLHIALTKVLKRNRLNIDEILPIYEEINEAELLTITEEVVEEKYKESEMMLVEVFEDINQPKSLVTRSKWLGDWEDSCQKFIEQEKYLNSILKVNTKLQNCHAQLASLINSHLGISGNMQAIINCFIKNVLLVN